MANQDLGRATLELAADGSRLNADLAKAEQTAKSKMTSIANGLGSAGKSMTKFVTLPLLGVGVAAVHAFTESNKVAAQTEAVLKSTGGAARVSAGDIHEYASTMQQKSLFDDEAIQSGENLLLTFTNISNQAGAGNDIFTQSTRIMTDMSQALGQDMKGSAIQLGKALNDPIKGVTALSRVGVSFTDQQKEQIKTLVKSGDTLGAQKIILAELNKEFGGSAEAARKADPMKAAMNDLGDAAESLGAILLPIVEKVSKGIQKMASWFQHLSPHAQKVVGILLAVAASIGPLLIGISKGIKAFQAMSKAFQVVSKLFMTNPWILIIAAVILLAILIFKHWGAIKQFLMDVWNSLLSVLKTVWNAMSGVIKTVVTFIGGLIRGYFNLYKAIILGVWNVIKAITTGAWNVIKTVIKAVVGFIAAVFRTYFNIYKTIITTAWNVIKTVTSAVWNFLKMIISGALNFIRAFISREINGIKAIVSGAWNLIKRITSTVWNALKGIVTTAVGGVMSVVSGIPGRITGALGNLGSLLYNAGRNVIQGLINGIKSMLGAVGKAVGGVAHKVRDFLPFSPAREGPLKDHPMDEAGRNIVRDLSSGITKSVPRVATAMTKTAAAVKRDLFGRPWGDPLYGMDKAAGFTKVAAMPRVPMKVPSVSVNIPDVIMKASGDQLTVLRRIESLLSKLQPTLELDGEKLVRRVTSEVQSQIRWGVTR